MPEDHRRIHHHHPFLFLPFQGLCFSSSLQWTVSDPALSLLYLQMQWRIEGTSNRSSDAYSHKNFIDVTEVFDAASVDGNLLLDFLTFTANFRATADKQLVQATLALIQDLTFVKDGKRYGNQQDSIIFIHK